MKTTQSETVSREALLSAFDTLASIGRGREVIAALGAVVRPAIGLDFAHMPAFATICRAISEGHLNGTLCDATKPGSYGTNP